MNGNIESTEEWAAEIGRGMIAFGAIEGAVDMCLKHALRDPIQRFARDLYLGPRIDLLLELLQGRSGECYAEVGTLLRQAKVLAKTRNTIAHSPLMLDVYLKHDDSFHVKQTISDRKTDKRRLSFTDVTQFADESAALSSNLYTCVCRVNAAIDAERTVQ